MNTFQRMVVANQCYLKLKPLLQQGDLYIGSDNRITRDHTAGIIESPWVMHNIDKRDKNCALLHELTFKHYGVIPKQCFGCWKVVVRPKTVVDLFKLSELQETLTYPCKAGIETRAYVQANYGGYFYCDSKEEGRERREWVKQLVDKHLAPDTDVYLKRACTEFEATFGDSDKWELDPMEEIYTAWINKYIDPDIFGDGFEFASYVKLDTKVKWLRFAAERGDMTYKEFTDGEEMYPAPVTYHGEEV